MEPIVVYRFFESIVNGVQRVRAVGFGSVTIRLDVSIVQNLGDHTNTVSGEASLFDYFEKFAAIYQVDPENANE